MTSQIKGATECRLGYKWVALEAWTLVLDQFWVSIITQVIKYTRLGFGHENYSEGKRFGYHTNSKHESFNLIKMCLHSTLLALRPPPLTDEVNN